MNAQTYDPVNYYMNKWKSGGAKDAILSTMPSSNHIPETHFAEAMKLRYEESRRYTELNKRAGQQEKQMAEAGNAVSSLMAEVKSKTQENSKLREERDDFSRFIVDNASVFGGGSGAV